MLRVQTHAPSGEDRSVGRSTGRSGLVVVALFVAGCLRGLGDLPARPAHGAPSSDVTALATVFGEITEDAQPIVPLTAVAAPDLDIAIATPDAPPATTVA